MSIFCTFDNLTLRAAIQTSQTIFRNHPPQPRLLLSSEDTKIKSHLIPIFAINAWQFWRHELLLSNRQLTIMPLHCTEMHVVSFLPIGFTTMAVINPPERKLDNPTSVHWGVHF
jgi:hypothetical protein